ncbi:pilus assembly PilX family protein [Methylogaea oryzae]|uniref:Pilus assembly protein PilX n=1 Tax=Methylogaea oryzae TaxID=1295382 RepID=A0A8D5AN64_9GAMM|nr:PilX N-terminal domain-containing pilus assembly protein [Methylogaea oryzae]BBL71775.1 pilus assembly protein PilX [Methylogaea oryzae]
MKRRFAIKGGSPREQRGATLMVAMVFMGILAVLGASAATNTGLQERMAGNSRNRDLAFQAAEAALQDAENTLTAWRVSAFDGSAAGLTVYDATRANDAVYWGDMANWASYKTPAYNLNQVAEQPRYVVEKMPCVSNTEHYRVTARGVGGDSNAVVVLQAVYSYTPNPGPCLP